MINLHGIGMFSKRTEEHIRHSREVVVILRLAGVTLKLKNCQFITEIIDYLERVTPKTSENCFPHNRRYKRT